MGGGYGSNPGGLGDQRRRLGGSPRGRIYILAFRVKFSGATILAKSFFAHRSDFGPKSVDLAEVAQFWRAFGPWAVSANSCALVRFRTMPARSGPVLGEFGRTWPMGKGVRRLVRPFGRRRLRFSMANRSVGAQFFSWSCASGWIGMLFFVQPRGDIAVVSLVFELASGGGRTCPGL